MVLYASAVCATTKGCINGVYLCGDNLMDGAIIGNTLHVILLRLSTFDSPNMCTDIKGLFRNSVQVHYFAIISFIEKQQIYVLNG